MFLLLLFFFFFNDTATTEIYTLSLHDALPIPARHRRRAVRPRGDRWRRATWRFAQARERRVARPSWRPSSLQKLRASRRARWGRRARAARTAGGRSRTETGTRGRPRAAHTR